MAARSIRIDPPHKHAAPSPELDDIALLYEGGRALEERLGPEGLLRFLQLVGDGRARFEDIRKEWADLTLDEALAAMGIPPTGEPAKQP